MAQNTEIKILENGKISVNGVVVDCATPSVEDVSEEEVEDVMLEESSRESYSKAGKSGAQ